MKTRLAVRVVLGVAGSGLLLGLLLSAAQQDAAQNLVIEMTAKKYEYSPSEIRVKRGAHVELRIRATDRDHGIRFDLRPAGAERNSPPGLRFEDGLDNWRLEKDEVRVIRFTAERAGNYEFKCSVTCGFGHRRMKGRLVVEE
jgi:heme/copper-type cytochrome/quinol oxidase subunit 2